MGDSPWLVSSGLFMGHNFSAGDDHIYKCAKKMLKKPGNLTTWRSVGTNHHIQKVVNDKCLGRRMVASKHFFMKIFLISGSLTASVEIEFISNFWQIKNHVPDTNKINYSNSFPTLLSARMSSGVRCFGIDYLPAC